MRELPEAVLAGIASLVVAGHCRSRKPGYLLAPLSEQTWEGSIYRWMADYWLAIVDLTTGSESVSDLSLHAKLNEGGDVEVYGVYVA